MRLERNRSKHTDLFRWLNNERLQNQIGEPSVYGRNSPASRKRVARLIGELQSLSELLSQSRMTQLAVDYWMNAPREIKNQIKKVDELLSQYPTRPVVEISNKDGSGGLYIEYASTGGRPLGEQIAVSHIRRIVNEQALDRIRLCECERWYLATRTDQKSCSAKCRHRIYEQKPDAKARRKIYMKAYYQLKQSGKVK